MKFGTCEVCGPCRRLTGISLDIIAEVGEQRLVNSFNLMLGLLRNKSMVILYESDTWKKFRFPSNGLLFIRLERKYIREDASVGHNFKNSTGILYIPYIIYGILHHFYNVTAYACVLLSTFSLQGSIWSSRRSVLNWCSPSESLEVTIQILDKLFVCDPGLLFSVQTLSQEFRKVSSLKNDETGMNNLAVHILAYGNRMPIILYLHDLIY